ncbi:hypothetical protein [Roseivirga misakiensis]|uniref:Uncharacterized protein n=1 Tax=Roseivirga misakiensis TaxID=1563681 RepID=A0A1E5T202_9BACT|nr:hypothetical protein [Roseivirga misakiensis]OEK05391.1 hypothetical protein BFP71_18545 [Roseivirga misakiensis]
MIEKSNSLQFHYIFQDDSHSIDSITRNECEKEILNLFNEVSITLGLNIDIQTLPPAEGGFKEFWKLLGQNSAQLTLVISVTAIILTRFPAENQELTELQIENLRLDNDIKRKELAKLNLEFIPDDEGLSDELLKGSVELVKKNYKVAWRKSNLFKKLIGYSKIDSIEVQRQHDFLPVGPSRKISKRRFPNFVLQSDDLPNLEGIIGSIDVISPAIKPGKFRWKGFYDKDIITFEMGHKAFKAHVLRGDVHFSNTFSIEVEMTQVRRIDSDGNIKVTNTIVNRVIATIENGIRVEFQND